MTAKKVFRVLIGEQQGFYVDTEAVSADEAMENICARLLRSSRSYKRLGRSYHPVRASSHIRFCPAQPSHFPKPAISLLAAGAAPASAKRRLAGGPTDRTPPAAAEPRRGYSRCSLYAPGSMILATAPAELHDCRCRLRTEARH